MILWSENQLCIFFRSIYIVHDMYIGLVTLTWKSTVNESTQYEIFLTMFHVKWCSYLDLGDWFQLTIFIIWMCIMIRKENRKKKKQPESSILSYKLSNVLKVKCMVSRLQVILRESDQVAFSLKKGKITSDLIYI